MQRVLQRRAEPTVTPCDVMHCSLANRSLSRGHSELQSYMVNHASCFMQAAEQNRLGLNLAAKTKFPSCTDSAYTLSPWLLSCRPKGGVCCKEDTSANSCRVGAENLLRQARGSCVAAGAVRQDGQRRAQQLARPDSVQPASFRWRNRPDPPPSKGNPRRRAHRPGW